MKKAASNKKTKKKQRIPLIVKWILVLLILLTITFTIFFIYMKQQTKPYRVALRYIETFMSKDVNALFDQMEFTHNSFTTPESLKNSLQEKLNYNKISSYSMVEYTNAEDENTKQYGIKWQTNERNSQYEQTLTLKKSGHKLYFLFDNWKIDTSDYLAKNCVLGAPANAKVTIDNTELAENKASAESANIVTYKLGDFFTGSHTIAVSMKGFRDYFTTINLKKGDYSKQNIYTITPSMLKITDDTQNTLEKETEKLIHSIYQSALGGKSFQKLAKDFTFENTSLENLEHAYNSLIANNIKSATHLTNVDFTSCSASTATTYAEDGCYAVQVTANLDYTATSVVVKNNVAENGTSQPARQSRSGSGSSLFTTTFHYKNGTWSIFDTTALDACIYYIKY